MSILKTLKDQCLVARKDKNEIAKSLLITLLGELESRAKRDSKEITDELVISTIKKFLDSANDTLKLVNGANEDSAEKCRTEISILKNFLPVQMTELEITALFVSNNFSNVGEAMAFLKKTKIGLYDGKVASAVAKKLFS